MTVNPSQHYEVVVRVVVDPSEWTEHHIAEVLRGAIDAALPSGRVGGLQVQGSRVHDVRRMDSD